VKKHLYILDCDGPLRSVSWQSIYDSYIPISERFDIDFDALCPDLEFFKEWFDHNWKKNLMRMGITAEMDMQEAVKIFHDHYDQNIHTFPWVADKTEKMSMRGHVTVLSNSSTASITQSLNGVKKHMSMIAGYDAVPRPKPHPDGIYQIISALNADPAYAVMIGDTYADIVAGKEAGIRTVTVSWGLTDTPEALHALGADQIITDPDEFLSLW
jgi:HAD superfamily hydrolase (TIGR01509 family)